MNGGVSLAVDVGGTFTDVVLVDGTPRAEIEGTFDVVVANILAPALVSLANDLRRLTARRGRLIVSGVLVDRHAHVLDALAPMVVEDVQHEGGWAAVTLRHPDVGPAGIDSAGIGSAGPGSAGVTT